jgi:amino acid permease
VEDAQADEAADGNTDMKDSGLAGEVPGPRPPVDPALAADKVPAPAKPGDGADGGDGYAAALSNRQVQMIAMGGAIGVGPKMEI